MVRSFAKGWGRNFSAMWIDPSIDYVIFQRCTKSSWTMCRTLVRVFRTLYYQVEETRVVVIGLFHTSDPQSWQDRVKEAE